MLWLGSVNFTFAQANNIQITISPLYGALPISLADSSFELNDSSALRIDVLKFYISGFRFLKSNTIVLDTPGLYHLVDASRPESLNFDISASQQIDFDRIVFNLGIDSVANVSGAFGGALDPTNGMYWTWQSGYINFKLEGSSRNSPARNNEFEFHLGGYQQPYASLQLVSLPTKSSLQINIEIDVKEILDNIDLTVQHHLMSPGSEAVTLSQLVARTMRIK